VVGDDVVKTIIREGRPIPADEVFEAWMSADIQRMSRALALKTNPIDRHLLLMTLFQQAYKRRKGEPGMRELARKVGLQHVQEFSDLRSPLVRDIGMLPRVPTFQNVATLLAEEGDLDLAIEVCEKATGFGLSDGTKGDFAARIDRLQKLAARTTVIEERGAASDKG
jgi:hypothetical protein